MAILIGLIAASDLSRHFPVLRASARDKAYLGFHVGRTRRRTHSGRRMEHDVCEGQPAAEFVVHWASGTTHMSATLECLKGWPSSSVGQLGRHGLDQLLQTKLVSHEGIHSWEASFHLQYNRDA